MCGIVILCASYMLILCVPDELFPVDDAHEMAARQTQARKMASGATAQGSGNPAPAPAPPPTAAEGESASEEEEDD